MIHQAVGSSGSKLWSAKHPRLPDNAPGIVYVNDRCINCSACSMFAPGVFKESTASSHHIVYQQPSTEEDIQHAREALAACPVAAIRLESPFERKRISSYSIWDDHDQQLVDRMVRKNMKRALFPRKFLDSVPDVYWVGHHNSASFGATPYLLKTLDERWIMIDSPKYTPSAVQAVTSLAGSKGPDYLVLTHVDDTADHLKWKQHFNRLHRVFHSSDLGEPNWLGDDTLEDVEILIENNPNSSQEKYLSAFTIDGKVMDYAAIDWSTQSDPILLHTPGHTPGSISLYYHPRRILFTGDTYAYSTSTQSMSGLPQFGDDRLQQAETLLRLLSLDWTIVAPGHDHPRDYRSVVDSNLREKEMQQAIVELRGWPMRLG